MKMENRGKYSCNTAAETLEWIKAIVEFLKPYNFFFHSNVVNFLKDRLWEFVDQDWIHCLKHEPGHHLLQIPSGIVQDHWPASLKDYVLTARSLSFPREQADLDKVIPGMSVISLNNVLSQGMNPKKKHEVEVLSSLVNAVSRNIGAHTVIDVGAGQGYLSLMLAFEYQLPVVAIDATSHHGDVTNIRAERIKKHYAAKQRNSGKEPPNIPTTITCHVMSSSMLRDLGNYYCERNGFDKEKQNGTSSNDNFHAKFKVSDPQFESSLVLAGLHACGDLSVTMLRAFAECKEVKAVVSIGCCYNLLSEIGCKNVDSNCGFPVSKEVEIMGVSLGKNARDLACQSAERWQALETNAGIQNFDLHGFRAAFQMVLSRYYPEILLMNPSIGRQGKVLRRQQKKSAFQSSNSKENMIPKTNVEIHSSTDRNHCSPDDINENMADNYMLFQKFSDSGLCHLGLDPLQHMDLLGLWTECQPYFVCLLLSRFFPFNPTHVSFDIEFFVCFIRCLPIFWIYFYDDSKYMLKSKEGKERRMHWFQELLLSHIQDLPFPISYYSIFYS